MLPACLPRHNRLTRREPCPYPQSIKPYCSATQESQRMAIQRLIRENHTLQTRLDTATQAYREMDSQLQHLHAAVRYADDRTRSREQTIRETARSVADERTRRQAAEATLQALSASKIPWGTLALGWCLGATTVLVWAFW